MFVDVRMEEFLYEMLDKKVPTRANNHELLGESMIDSGHEFGPGTAYGKLITQYRPTQKWTLTASPSIWSCEHKLNYCDVTKSNHASLDKQLLVMILSSTPTEQECCSKSSVKHAVIMFVNVIRLVYSKDMYFDMTPSVYLRI